MPENILYDRKVSGCNSHFQTFYEEVDHEVFSLEIFVASHGYTDHAHTHMFNI